MTLKVFLTIMSFSLSLHHGEDIDLKCIRSCVLFFANVFPYYIFHLCSFYGPVKILKMDRNDIKMSSFKLLKCMLSKL